MSHGNAMQQNMPAVSPPLEFTDRPIMPIMIDLHGGEFSMGDTNGRRDEQPVHRVAVDPFAIAVFAVSNAEYAVFLDQAGRDKPIGWGAPRFDRPDYPVCGVSWYDAVAYCDWLTELTGDRYHLPTEAQREYAARGGHEQRAYPWGDDPLTLTGPYAPGLSGPITGGPMTMSYPDAAGPNGFELYHMADNVHEWCADYYDAQYYGDDEAVNPRGPLTATNRRSARGGSWRHDIKFCRCAARSSLGPDKRFADFGFRVMQSDAFEYVE